MRVTITTEQMTANIKENADNASQTEKIARQSATDAQMSGEAVSRAVAPMQTISASEERSSPPRSASCRTTARRRHLSRFLRP